MWQTDVTDRHDRLMWRTDVTDRCEGKTWRTDMTDRRDGQMWRTDVTDRDDRQTWRTDVMEERRHGRWESTAVGQAAGLVEQWIWTVPTVKQPIRWLFWRATNHRKEILFIQKKHWICWGKVHFVSIFLKSIERENGMGRGGEEEENMAKQSYHVLKPWFMKLFVKGLFCLLRIPWYGKICRLLGEKEKNGSMYYQNSNFLISCLSLKRQGSF